MMGDGDAYSEYTALVLRKVEKSCGRRDHVSSDDRALLLSISS
jgi:hypothetical protein